MAADFISFSIITPTYNSERFFEACIRSLVEQNYPALEYIVIDGGSADGTLDIIQRYKDRIAYWVSEPDNGMYAGIQKGFEHSHGEIMAWLNSDDMYLPWTLRVVNDIFSALPNIDWITSLRPLLWNAQGLATECMALPGFSKDGFCRGEHMPGSKGFMIEAIQQESTFWRRSLWERAGGSLDTSLQLAGDFELWARFYQHSELVGVRTPLGGFRVHAEQLTASKRDLYITEARTVLHRYHGSEQGWLRSFLRQRVASTVPRRLRAKAAGLGLLHPSRACVYDQSRGGWTIRADHI
jgi:glycosyltransferase involved in cell wall biosynthesis